MRFVKALAILITALLVTLFAVNHSDVAQSPEVTAILSKTVVATEEQQAAFYYVLGLHADPAAVPQATTDPEAAGRDLWPRFHALPPGERKSFWNSHISKKPVWTQTPITCTGAPLGICTTGYLKTHPFAAEFLKRDPEVLKKYIRLMEYGAGINLFYGDDQILFSRLWVVSPGVHRQYLLQLADWSRAGDSRRAIHELELSSRYLRDILSNGNLFERTVAVQQLALNAAFLKAELDEHPKAKVSAELLETLTAPPLDKILKGAFDKEVQFTAHAIANFAADPLTSVLRPLIFKPNETLNEFYEKNLNELSSPNSQAETAKMLWSWLENPLGRSLLQKFALHFSQRRPRFEEGLKRLGQDQLKISERR